MNAPANNAPSGSSGDFPDSTTTPENSPDVDDELGTVGTFPIVGVGASAGGLEAFTQLLKALPPDTGMAFVFIQHLAPSHPSALAEILSRSTIMRVMEVRDNTAVEPNHVYVIPPDRSMSLAGGALQLLPREGRGAHHPVDQFFRALAQERRHQAIGVVLSGTASDGTLGLEEIKAEGGITFAQDATAQHDGMPQSAIASGCVDFVMSPDGIAREIVSIGQHPYSAIDAVSPEMENKPNLTEVVQILRDHTGVDFTRYRFGTLYRRVTRRMVFHKMNGLTEYVRYLRQTPVEVAALYQDILISVTNFFRDKESFEALKSTVFPRLLKDRAPYDTVRLWTLGCSTGQEAYSLAIVFMEAAEAAGSSVPLQLFASDLNAAGIDKARTGFYPKSIAQEMSPERLRRLFTEVDGLHKSGDYVSHFDTVRKRSDGLPVEVALTISPIRDEANEIVGISKTARDITEKKEAEQRIYGLMNELKDADRRKDEFLATLAHELRNPLAPIRKSLEVMKRADGNTELIAQALAMMDRQIGQMVRLVDDLLDISRITRDMVRLRKDRVELASIIHHAVEMCRPQIQNAEHEITVKLPPEPIYVHADSVRLAQVISNLLYNACKFTEPKGHIWLVVERQGGDVVVSVKDNGIGIPGDMLLKVFEMFTQIDSSLERSQGGLGIGLTLVKRLVEMHDGTVTAFSDGKGAGSEFVVRLPILTEKTKPSQSQIPTGTTIPTTARCILVVDDNRDSGTSLATLLQLTGNDTQTAYDGKEAVEMAAAYKPDVILLDIGLPKMNGYRACEAIRKQPWARNIVIVALTGWGQEEDRRKSKEAGFDGHMVKPVDHADLMTLLGELDVGTA